MTDNRGNRHGNHSQQTLQTQTLGVRKARETKGPGRGATHSSAIRGATGEVCSAASAKIGTPTPQAPIAPEAHTKVSEFRGALSGGHESSGSFIHQAASRNNPPPGQQQDGESGDAAAGAWASQRRGQDRKAAGPRRGSARVRLKNAESSPWQQEEDSVASWGLVPPSALIQGRKQ